MKRKIVREAQKRELVIGLLDIRSVHNVGAIFRTADAAGATKIFCVGYTPTPNDRFGRVRPDIQKTALGAEKSVPWEGVSRASTLIKRLKNKGYTIIALEQDLRSVDYKKAKFKKEKIALLVGNETGGIPKKILDHCDMIVEIPMRGKKESLNVSVAVGVVLFRIFDR